MYESPLSLGTQLTFFWISNILSGWAETIIFHCVCLSCFLWHKTTYFYPFKICSPLNMEKLRAKPRQRTWYLATFARSLKVFQRFWRRRQWILRISHRSWQEKGRLKQTISSRTRLRSISIMWFWWILNLPMPLQSPLRHWAIQPRKREAARKSPEARAAFRAVCFRANLQVTQMVNQRTKSSPTNTHRWRVARSLAAKEHFLSN